MKRTPVEMLSKSIPSRKKNPTSLAEVITMHTTNSPRLKDFKLLSIGEVETCDVAAAYYEMQRNNPLFKEANLTKKEILIYAGHLVERAKHLSEWNQVVVAPDGTVAGLYIAYPAQATYKEEERARTISKATEEHWQTCLWFEKRVLERVEGELKRLRQNVDNFKLLYSVFTGCHPKYLGLGIYEYIGSANAVAAELAGYTHMWGFTFNPAFMKKALNQKGCPEFISSYVADAVPTWPQWFLDGVLTPCLRFAGMIRPSTITFAVPRNGISWVCIVWPTYDDPTLGRSKPKVSVAEEPVTAAKL